MEISPVLFLIFNRPDVTESVFARIKEARPSKLFIAADGPRKDKPGEAELCAVTRNAVLDNINWPCEVFTLLRDTNLGCKVAVSSAINWFFKHVEQGIILEDDTLPDISFFTFCTEMLNRYNDDVRITQISGFNLMGKSPELNASYLFSKIGGIWGWASWRRAWNTYDIDIGTWGTNGKQQIQNFLNNRQWLKQLEPNFNSVYLKQIDTWDYQWVYAQLYNSGLIIIPSVNLVENIGFNRVDATHTKGANNLIDLLKTNNLTFPLQHTNNVVSNAAYTAYYFDLLPKPNSTIDIGVKKIKRLIHNLFKTSK